MIKYLRRSVATFLSIVLVTGIFLPVEISARPVPTDAKSYGFGQQLDLRLLAEAGLLTDANGNETGLDVVELQGAQQAWDELQDNGQTAEPQDISVGVLGGLYIDLPGLRLPLIGEDSLLGDSTLLDQNLGALREYANAPYATKATGATGLITNDGALDLHANPGDGGNIQLDLTGLLKLNTALEPILEKAALEIGAVSASAQKPDAFLKDDPLCDTEGNSLVDYSQLDNAGIGSDYGIFDPSDLTAQDKEFCSGYQIADAIITIDSPLVDDLTTTVTGLITGLDGLLNTAIGEQGLLNQLTGLLESLDLSLLGLNIASVNSTAQISVDLKLDDIVGQLLNEDKPLADSTGLLYLNLGSGEIQIDLAKLHQEGLNSLDPNTPLLSDAELTKITNALNDLLLAGSADNPNGLNARLEGLLYGDKLPNGEYAQTGGLYAAEVKLDLGLSVRLLILPSISTSLTLETTLGGLLNPDAVTTEDRSFYEDNPYDYVYRDGSGALNLLGVLLDAVGDITGLVGGILKGILFGTNNDGGLVAGLLQSVIPAANTLISAIEPLLEGVVRELADVIVNRQKVEQKDQGILFTVSALEVNLARSLLGNTLATLPLATASVLAQSFKPSSLEIGKFVINDDNFTIPDDYTLSYTCTHEDFEEAYQTRPIDENSPILVTDRLTGEVVLSGGETEVIENLPAGASCEISETDLDLQDPTIKWTQEWTTDSNWMIDEPTSSAQTPAELTTEHTVFIGIINRFESALINLDLQTAKIGDGQGLHQDGYSYSLQCTLEDWDSGVITIDYSADAVGESFAFEDEQFLLNGANNVASSTEVLPGAECTVSTTTGISSNKALRPTGDNREPYTYFLDTIDGDPVIANSLSSNEISVGSTDHLVSVNADEVGAGWKTHSYTFVVPVEATSHMVNVVHAYDIDRRDVVVTKIVEAAFPNAPGPFNFQYSVNGETWVAPSEEIKNGDSFTIKDVPLIDGTTLAETQIAVREEIIAAGDELPNVTWSFTDPDEDLTATKDNTYSTTNQFSVARGITEASTTTPVLELTAKNSYPVTINFEAMLPKTGQTTLVWVIGLGLLTALGAVIMYVRSRKQ